MQLLYMSSVVLAMLSLVAAAVIRLSRYEVFRCFRMMPWKKRMAALAALAIVAAYGGTKPGAGLLSILRPRSTVESLTAFTEGELAAGFALAGIGTNETHSFDEPSTAAIHEPWRLRGAHEDVFRIPATNWSFRFGGASVTQAFVSAGGAVALDWPGTNRLDAFAAPLGIVPESNWRLLGTNSVFWHDAVAGALRLTWRNALLDRSPDSPVSFQVTLDPSGDFTYRYSDFAWSTSGVSVAAGANGTAIAYTNGPATTLRWASIEGLANDADFDGDGLSDSDEVLLYGTDPRLADTDLDGIADGQEIQLGSNPINPDEDGDGVPDGSTPAEWYGNALWASNAVPNARAFTITLNNAVPLDETASLAVGDLYIPLRAPGTWTLGFVPGELYDYRLTVNGHRPLDLSIAPVESAPRLRFASNAEATALYLDGIGATFDGFSHGGSRYLSVPVVTPIWIDPGDGSHQNGDDVCLHGGDKAQYLLLVRPSQLRNKLIVNGLEDNNGLLELTVPNTGTSRSGIIMLPIYETRFAPITRLVSAHRCDSSYYSPYCSICGHYQPDDLTLFILSKLTLKHDNQTTIFLIHPNSVNVSIDNVIVDVRRKGTTNWEILGAVSGITNWTARIAGIFEFRGRGSIDGVAIETPIVEAEVQFPAINQIVNDPGVQTRALQEWNATLNDCTEEPNRRREHGYWIMLNTATDLYSAESTTNGAWAIDLETPSVVMPAPPPTIHFLLGHVI